MTSDLETLFDAAANQLAHGIATRRLTGVAYFGTEYHAAFAMDKPASGGDRPRADRQPMQERYSRFDREGDRYGDVGRQPSDLAAILAVGKSYRDARWDPSRMGLSAWRSRLAERRDRGADDHGHLDEKHNEKLASRGGDPLETYVRDLLSKLPNGTKVSIGGQWGKTFAFGVPGRSVVFVNPMVDYSNKASGFSLSIGGGPLTHGGFINLSYMEGRYEFSAGGFFAIPTGQAGQLSINITDLIGGTLTFSEAASSPIIGPTAVPSSVQVSIDVKPVEILYDAFTKVLGPLSDYRNFQSPMGDF